MTNTLHWRSRSVGELSLSLHLLLIVIFSLIALALTQGLANSSVDIGTRTNGFWAIAAGYLGVSIAICLWGWLRVRAAADALHEAEIEQALRELEEANDLIAGSLKVADTYRLISHKVHRLLGCHSSALLLLDRSRTQLETVTAAGQLACKLRERKIPMETSLAGRCFSSASVAFSDPFESEREGLDVLDGAPATSASIPLVRDGEPFGVMEMYFTRRPTRLTEMSSTLEAIGTRVSSLVLSSLVFERNQERALTDVLTELPNERAFQYVFENQIAATQRSIEPRLSLLVIDIKGFSQINRSRGHAAGDAALSFVARTLQENLRQMDFLARSRDDEFFAVLPTATEEITFEIIGRLDAAFRQRPMPHPGSEPINIELNIGWAVFGKDGDSCEGLLARARLRMDVEQGTASPRTVIMFPRSNTVT